MRCGWYELNNPIDANLLWDGAAFEISERKNGERLLEYAQ
jgi:hypothetical protein